MITIKSASYTQDEIKLLGHLFCKMETTLLTEYCKDYHCTTCPYRHICEAIYSANEYISNKVK